MSTPLAVLIVVLAGGSLIYAATRAAQSVREGPVFLRWMVVVFACFVILAALPVILGL